MNPEPVPISRLAALAAVVAAGLASLIGSSAGPGPECSFFSNSCNPVVGPIPPVPLASITPQRSTVQVGSALTLQAQALNFDQPSYSWCRAPTAGGACETIPGADGASLTLANVTLADDATAFRVTVVGRGGETAYGIAQVAVSSAPGVAFADSDFADAGWTASGFSEPAPAGAWHAEAQLTTAGNPGAWRRTNFELQTGPSRVRLYHDAPAMRYDPAASGAIYVVDVGEDCINADDNPVSRAAFTTPTIVQGARRYVASDSWWHYCGSTVWTRYERPSLQAGDFVLVDGPACASGESCPDFGAAAAPLVFGYVLSAERPAGASGGSGAHGIDNLRITVWRR